MSDATGSLARMNPTIDDILRSFFALRLEGATGVRRRRILLVHDTLRLYLEREGFRVLTTGDLVLLQLERALDPTDGFTRTMHADDLVFALPGYLEQPMADRLDRRVRRTLVEALVDRLIALRFIDEYELACPLLDLRAALDRGRADDRRGAPR